MQFYAPTLSHEDEEIKGVHEDVARSVDKNKSHYKILRGRME
jgi:hypothetical protein